MSDPARTRAESAVRGSLEWERRAAGLLCVGFDGQAVPVHTRGQLERGVRTVILFTRNGNRPNEIATLTSALRAAAPERLLICVDQEGGSVQRFRDGFEMWGDPRDVPDAAAAEARGAGIARELRACGIDLNLAPVVDVDSNPANPVIGARSFGADPEHVAALGAAMIRGLQAGGVAACAKHFPGHGDTSTDSHLELPVLEHDLERLRRVELPPFRAAIAAEVAAIMTAHIVFPALDAHRPATMSPAVIAGLLRGELGYDGVVTSDCYEMEAIAGHDDLGAAAVAAVGAGVDLLLCCHREDRQEQIITALAQAAQDGVIEPERLARAERRLAALRARYVV